MRQRTDSFSPTTSAESDHDRVRTIDPTIATLIRQATERSQTFQRLVDLINASNGIVYIEKGICGHGVRGCFVNVTMAGSNRMLWVMVDPRGVDCDVMGLIGHELRHALEVLDDPSVTGFSNMYFLYTREGRNNFRSSPFETDEAERAGFTVRAEVRQKGRCISSSR